MRRGKSKKRTEGSGWGWGGVMGKGTNLQTLSRAATTFPPRVASHLRVSKIRTELSVDRTADGGNVGERRKGEPKKVGRGEEVWGRGGKRWRKKRPNIFFKVKYLRNVSENNLAAAAMAAAWGRRGP